MVDILNDGSMITKWLGKGRLLICQQDSPPKIYDCLRDELQLLALNNTQEYMDFAFNSKMNVLASKKLD